MSRQQLTWYNSLTSEGEIVTTKDLEPFEVCSDKIQFIDPLWIFCQQIKELSCHQREENQQGFSQDKPSQGYQNIQGTYTVRLWIKPSLAGEEAETYKFTSTKIRRDNTLQAHHNRQKQAADQRLITHQKREGRNLYFQPTTEKEAAAYTPHTAADLRRPVPHTVCTAEQIGGPHPIKIPATAEMERPQPVGTSHSRVEEGRTLELSHNIWEKEPHPPQQGYHNQNTKRPHPNNPQGLPLPHTTQTLQ